MKTQLTDETLAKLVTHVTQTMLGMVFRVEQKAHKETEPLMRAAVLDVAGIPGIVVALSSSEESCAAIGAAMFMTTPEKVDHMMMNDSLSELVNMTAGQIKNALSMDRTLGLPRVLSAGTKIDTEKGNWRTVRMTSGRNELVLWLGETK